MEEIKKSIKAFIFDMDGTIIKTEDVWHHTTRTTLAKHGHTTLTQEQEDFIVSLAGIGLKESVIQIKEIFNIADDVDEIVKEKQEIFFEIMKNNKPAFVKGFEDFHKKLHDNHIPSCIATNAEDTSLERLSAQMNFPSFFGEHIYNISCVDNKTKPDPALFLHAAKKLGAKPEECLVFEDSIFGFQAAKAAGMQCIAIKNNDNIDILHLATEAIDNYHEAEEALRNVIKEHS